MYSSASTIAIGRCRSGCSCGLASNWFVSFLVFSAVLPNLRPKLLPFCPIHESSLMCCVSLSSSLHIILCLCSLRSMDCISDKDDTVLFDQFLSPVPISYSSSVLVGRRWRRSSRTCREQVLRTCRKAVRLLSRPVNPLFTILAAAANRPCSAPPHALAHLVPARRDVFCVELQACARIAVLRAGCYMTVLPWMVVAPMPSCQCSHCSNLYRCFSAFVCVILLLLSNVLRMRSQIVTLTHSSVPSGDNPWCPLLDLSYHWCVVSLFFCKLDGWDTEQFAVTCHSHVHPSSCL